ncbi:hypothetical protein [Photobacterium leiognathi]|nr:hypothetical protein [Photobacterium leiognathi]
MCTKCIKAAASQAKDGQPTIEVVAMGDASNMPDELKAAAAH